jgi:DNA ligase-1
MELPQLYSRDKSGKLRYWNIRVYEDATIIKKYGSVGGKEMQSSTHIDAGKNIGKSNETTPFEQACLMATSLWKKHTEMGFCENKDDVGVKILPMLANSWDDRNNHISEPFYVQPKLDGVRCIMGQYQGALIMLTRTGKVIQTMGHIMDDVGCTLNEGEFLDGELYSDQLTFEEISGLCRTTSKTHQHIQIKFHCFDFFKLDALSDPFEQRFKKLETLFKNLPHLHLHKVETTRVLSKKMINRWHDTFVSKGFEGIIIRDANGTYELNERSNHLLKMKKFETDEYRIVGVEDAKGNDAGTVVWVCETSDGKKFSVRPKGTREQRSYWLENQNIFTDGTKRLTVQYQNILESGIPRFPVGLTIRDYE